MIRKPRRLSAFTFVEVMAALVISIMALTAGYALWSRISRQFTLSTTRQRLQSELRKTAEIMARDFKAIKKGTLSADSRSSAERNDLNFSFEVFKELGDEEKNTDGNVKLAQEFVSKITYNLNSSVLSREEDGKGKKILSISVESIVLDSQGASASGEEKKKKLTADELWEAGKQAKLDIVVTGKAKVPGTGKDIYHEERTSIVMRDEFNQIMAQNYVSLADLFTKESDEVIKTAEEGEDPFGDGMSEDFLASLPREVLDSMLNSKNQEKGQLEDYIKKVNEDSGDVDIGKRWFFHSQYSSSLSSLKDDLKKSQTVDDTKKAQKGLEGEIQFIENNYMKRFLGDVPTIPSRKDFQTEDAYNAKIAELSKDPAKLREARINQEAIQMALMDKDTRKTNENDGEDLEKGTSIEGYRKASADAASSSTPLSQEERDYRSAVEERYNQIVSSEAYTSWDHKDSTLWIDGADKKDYEAYCGAKTLVNYAITKGQVQETLAGVQDTITAIENAKKTT